MGCMYISREGVVVALARLFACRRVVEVERQTGTGRDDTTRHDTTQHDTTQHNTTQHNTTRFFFFLPLRKDARSGGHTAAIHPPARCPPLGHHHWRAGATPPPPRFTYRRTGSTAENGHNAHPWTILARLYTVLIEQSDMGYLRGHQSSSVPCLACVIDREKSQS